MVLLFNTQNLVVKTNKLEVEQLFTGRINCRTQGELGPIPDIFRLVQAQQKVLLFHPRI
jgi:hypothetical protein